MGLRDAPHDNDASGVSREEARSLALAYAARGWPVLPLKQNGKEPLTVHGLDDATTDLAQVEAWFTQWPDANVGVRTGIESELVVLDVDGDEGADSLAELERAHGKLPPTSSVKTPHGQHFYFRHPGKGEVRNTASYPGPRLDVRGDGGYVVAPPSVADGRPYTSDDECEPADLPAWLLQLLQERSQAKNGSVHQRDAAIPTGLRNDALTSFAGTMRRRGMSEGAIAAALLVENKARCKPPLPDDEVQRIAHSVARYKPADDAVASLEELTRILGLDKAGKRIDQARIFGRGSNAIAHIELDDGERIVLEPLGKFTNCAKLSAEIALQAGASLALKAQELMRVLVLLHKLADHHASVEMEDRAWELGADYLRNAAIGEVEMGNQASRWSAFYVLDRSQVQNIVLEDQLTGIRYVRIGWFAEYVRLHAGAQDSVLRAMPSLGWRKRGSEGRIKAMRPGFRDTLNFRFFEVPKGWEE